MEVQRCPGLAQGPIQPAAVANSRVSSLECCHPHKHALQLKHASRATACGCN